MGDTEGARGLGAGSEVKHRICDPHHIISQSRCYHPARLGALETVTPSGT